jgi:hypothetical protein
MRRAAVVVAWAALGLSGCWWAEGPTVRTYEAQPATPAGPAVPLCNDRPDPAVGVAKADVVTCWGGYTVSYDALSRAALAQAARFARGVGKTRVAPAGQTYQLTAPARTALACTVVTEPQEWMCAGGGSQSHCYPKWWKTPESTQTCSGGTAIAGSEGHVLQMSFSLLGATDAAPANAVDVASVLAP